METFNVYQAKTNLSRLLNLVQQGQSVTIAKSGKPIADLVPHQTKSLNLRKPGFLKGKITIAPDFDKYDQKIEKLFYESQIFPN